MAAITALPTDAPRTGNRAWSRARAAAVRAFGTLRNTASEARRRYRRPSLVVGSFTSAVASAWTTFGLGAGLLATSVALITLEFLSGDEHAPAERGS